MKTLRGKQVLITGAASGIGLECARSFARRGANLVISDVNATALEVLKREITSLGVSCLAQPCDVSSAESVAALAAATQAAVGPLDVLVNNAGIRSYEPLAEAKAETWQKILSVNLLSYAWLVRAALPALRKSGRGSIVNISSTHAVNPRAGMGQYDVAKAGILSMTRTLAFEETKNRVRVNAVCPGLTLTPFHVRRAAADGRTEQDLRTEVVDHNLQRRWADPREVAYPILWLASDEASFVTASTLMVDGGTRV